MSVLITGGSGLVGSFVSRELVSLGYEPVVYDVDPRPMLFQGFEDKIKVIRGNVCDLARMLHIIEDEKVDYIIHTAYMLTHEAEVRPAEACRTNVEGTTNVFEAAKLMKINRVVHMSSVSVYDISVPTETFKEDHPVGPNNIYGATKACNEFFACDFIERHGLDIIMFRPTLVWGPGQRPETGGGRIIKPIVENPFFGKNVEVTRGASFDIVYVKDMAKMICKVCFAKDLKHRVFNIGCGRRIELAEIADAVKELIPNANIRVTPGERDPLYAAAERAPVNITRLQEELGFTPQYDVRTCVKDYVALLKRWYPKN